MTKPHDQIENEALDWVIRQRDPIFDDWDGFTAWLGADPAHADVYHAVATADQDMGALLQSAPARRAEPIRPAPAFSPAPPPQRRAVGRRGWLGGAVAASLALVGGYGWMTTRALPYVVETAPGEHRTLALGDGTRIDLNGTTRLTLDRNHPRFASVDHGEALFTVVHDASRPFTVSVGGATLLDVGTVFNVVREAHETRVAVSEGAVVYNPDAEAVQLPAGKALRARDGDAPLDVTAVAPDSVAGWREGKLVYDGAPMAQVAEDLGRSLGLSVRAAPDVAARPVRGIITISGGDKEAMLRSVGPLLDIAIGREGQTWVLTAKGP
ncbi:FecR family protein [Flavisphingomonas formosensis]|uniref:FecR family protein n=1 Tax=Flavisphingomonas formosensis TaxID=861534 RepID=UPI0012F70C95|nr:FecR domain-containing protein [Sphingomonas formosensis]